MVEDAHVHLLRDKSKQTETIREQLREAGQNRLMPLLARHQLRWPSGQETKVTLGKKLRAAREAKPLSQRVAAELLGITRSSLQGHESGKVMPTDGALRKYKTLYGIDFSLE